MNNWIETMESYEAVASLSPFHSSSKNDDSDKSVVTIETTPDNKIVQVKARNNREASKEHLDFIKMWAENKNLKVEV